jgi:hypothetical protein
MAGSLGINAMPETPAVAGPVPAEQQNQAAEAREKAE